MSARLFGIETEYALAAINGRGASVDRTQALQALMRGARSSLPHLPDQYSHGMFLQNGARFYIDCGSHPEFTTPECASPWDAVRYIQAGERILLRLAGEHGGRQAGRIMLFRSNVDYSGARSTWGCHESYMHRADPRLLPKQIIPHLVSRLVYTGAGGFNNLSPGVEFTLSPRVPHMSNEISGDSTHSRGIFHTKDEALCGNGYHRLHLLCGESLCSELATWLKTGATALVVAMIEAGVSPGDGVELRAPVAAMRVFAGDPTCVAVAETVRGKRRTAIAIQRHYLSRAEAHVGDAFMPPWAAEVCRRWRGVLDCLESDVQSVTTTLDWAIKLALYKERVRRRGLAWESLALWTRVADRLCAALARTDDRNKPLTAELVLRANGPVADEVARLTPFVRDNGLSWNCFGAFLDVRQELFEIDTRFGQLGDNGIFAALDAAGVLAHHVDGVDDIEHAVSNPPSIGRARVRGEVVRQLSGSNDPYECDWQGVWDRQNGRVIDLSDPFACVSDWKQPKKDCPNEVIVPAFSLGTRLYEQFASLRNMQRTRAVRRRNQT